MALGRHSAAALVAQHGEVKWGLLERGEADQVVEDQDQDTIRALLEIPRSCRCADGGAALVTVGSHEGHEVRRIDMLVQGQDFLGLGRKLEAVPGSPRVALAVAEGESYCYMPGELPAAAAAAEAAAEVDLLAQLPTLVSSGSMRALH